MYFEFLFRRAPSRRRVAAMYWSGVSFDSLTTCSKEVTVGTTGPIGSGLPQFGLPRRFAILGQILRKESLAPITRNSLWYTGFPLRSRIGCESPTRIKRKSGF